MGGGKNPLRCPFCGIALRTTDEKRVLHRIRCQVIRDGKLRPRILRRA